MDTFNCVTDRIVRRLEDGELPPWHKPWVGVRTGCCYNRISKRPYSLLNSMILSHQGEYATFRQWTSLGGHIRQGEASEMVVFWKWQEEEETEMESETGTTKEGNSEKKSNRKRYPVLKHYSVYHVSQVEGVEPLVPEITLYDTDPVDCAEKLFREYTTREKISVETVLSDEAYYSPVQDRIHLPVIGQYRCPEEYYSTAYHEAVHSTGHANRLARLHPSKVAFTKDDYSREELVAEIGSAAILHRLGIQTDHCFDNSVAYIQSWIKALRDDRRMIVYAAAQAEKATRFIEGTNVRLVR